jgi:hypothetical protein
VLSRRGASLAELLVALVLAAVILAVATGTLLRQQRSVAGMVTGGHGVAQVRAATGVVSAQLAFAAASARDLVAGEARDTALQLRTPVASGIACDDAPSPSLAFGDDDLPVGGLSSVPRAGDSLWWYQADSARWNGQRVADAWTESGACPGAEAAGAVATLRRILRLRTDASDPATRIPERSPLRVTRQSRLSVYRAGDGTWQLGLRDWSDVTHSFASPQPAAGPLQRVAPDRAQTGFRYFDITGGQVFPEQAPATLPSVVRIRFTALAVPAPAAGPHNGAPARDSVDIALSVAAPR